MGCSIMAVAAVYISSPAARRRGKGESRMWGLVLRVLAVLGGAEVFSAVERGANQSCALAGGAAGAERLRFSTLRYPI